MPHTSKKKRAAAAAAGDGADGGGGSKRKDHSFWGLVGTLAGFVALFSWTVAHKAAQGKRKRQEDERLLTAMRRRPLRFTEHAACRADCRFVTRDQVAATLREGSINDRKSEPRLRPCPKYVVDAAVQASGSGNGSSRKNIQAVCLACPTETRVLTVIDRDTDWPCPPC